MLHEKHIRHNTLHEYMYDTTHYMNTCTTCTTCACKCKLKSEVYFISECKKKHDDDDYDEVKQYM